MSEFHVVCVRIGSIEKHPNADSLSPRFGRVQLKLAGEGYLTRRDGK